MSFDNEIRKVLGNEGGYSNNPNDSGGETNWGITVGVARINGYMGKMKDMSRETAVLIYKNEYWLKPGLDDINNINEDIAGEMFDTGVNCGQVKAVLYLQMALNALNRRGKDYSDIAEDGKIGPKTLAALKTFVQKRGKDGINVILRMLNVLQGYHYIELARAREKDEEFVFGWFRTRVVIPGRE